MRSMKRIITASILGFTVFMASYIGGSVYVWWLAGAILAAIAAYYGILVWGTAKLAQSFDEEW